MPANLTSNNSSTRKMATLVTCHKCKKLVNIKYTALCSACNNRYELDCDGYPEATYRLKDAEAKKKWRCKMCIRNKKYDNADGSSNITVRKKPPLLKMRSPTEQTNANQNMANETLCQSPVQHSTLLSDSHILTECETSDESYITPNKLPKSLDRTVFDLVSTSEMKNTISQITYKLESTENELGNILLENRDLHKQIKKLTIENETLKSICHCETIHDSPDNADTMKKKKQASSQQYNACSTPTSLSSHVVNINTKDNGEKLFLEEEIVTLKQQLEVAEREINALTERLAVLMRNSHTAPESNICKPKRSSMNTPTHRISTAANVQNMSLKRKIFLFGSQRCVGLAAALSLSRTDTQYETYQVVAETKPNAPSNEIITNCINTKLSTYDKLVICIGENDRNFSIILSQLQIILDMFKNNTIIVLNVLNNAYLNVNKLNYALKNRCHKYKKCHFVNQECTKFFDICKSINYIIDYSDYSDKYLNPSEIRKRLASNKSSLKNTGLKEPKKGTIPFYFSCPQINKSNECSNHTQPKTQGQKGTIPFYFPVLNKGNSFFRA